MGVLKGNLWSNLTYKINRIENQVFPLWGLPYSRPGSDKAKWLNEREEKKQQRDLGAKEVLEPRWNQREDGHQVEPCNHAKNHHQAHKVKLLRRHLKSITAPSRKNRGFLCENRPILATKSSYWIKRNQSFNIKNPSKQTERQTVRDS